MVVYIAGFICALVLAGIVVAWIAYCMFIRERHKSEYYQYNISDLKHKNDLLSLNHDDVEKEITAGVLILPSRHRQRDEEYGNRPDYPESPAPVSPSTEKLIDVFSDKAVEAYYKDGIYEVDSSAPCLIFHENNDIMLTFVNQL
ncbi:tRNA 5-methylaminomethyl-2-thiouridine biosynthesis bifunctional protein MnmC [Operophtera brumata]|uniref:tRNA 5-methylaminomethyl-2-thiouridine biosynthesis bifunctional protein MnmC n=1 Tax=Operophtera brumata TaxID=104452 RepID=A0A0L7LHQ5_OPEBR|nr:tRNA 5-methylaminomethyl-2-thiouridine biosynthesis bifunctional protein MnmC [Operophtera brumata]